MNRLAILRKNAKLTQRNVSDRLKITDLVKQENLNQAGELASKMFDIIFEENPSLDVPLLQNDRRRGKPAKDSVS